MIKKTILCLMLIILIFVLAGCYETSVRMNLDEEGDISFKSVVEGDTTAGSEDMDMVYWQLKTVFPEINVNYRTEREGRKVMKFEKIDKISHEELEYIEFSQKDDGSYNFEMVIPAIYSEEDDSDDLFLDIEVVLPEEIDMANTTNVDKNIARWSIRERDLHKENKLRAFTISK